MEHQVVSRRSLHRERRTGHAAASVPGPQSRATCCQARHAVAHIGARKLREALDNIGADLPFARQDSEPCWHKRLLPFVFIFQNGIPLYYDGERCKQTRASCEFRDVASGAKPDRTQLRRALATLERGDVRMVTRFDRLARSTRELLNTLPIVTDRKAGFRSLGDAWADTTTAHGRLMLA